MNFRFLVLLVLSGLFLPSAQAAPHVEWHFDNKASSVEQTYRCKVSFSDGVMRGEIDKNGYFFLPEFKFKGPVTLRFRMKTDTNLFDRGELYWSTEESPGMGFGQFMRFMPHHDGKWHEYELALPTTGTMTHLRFSPGWKDGVFWMDWLRVTHTPWPEAMQAQHDALPKTIEMKSNALNLTVSTRPHGYVLHDTRTDRIWRADASLTKALLVGVDQDGDSKARLTFYDHATASEYYCDLHLDTGAITFELSAQEPEKPFYSLNNYPPVFTTDSDRAKLMFCSRSCGIYADQDDEDFSNLLVEVWGNTSCTDMPWVGWTDPTRNDGMMALVETATDAYFQFVPDKAGRSWPQVIWRVSMDQFRYPRRLSYRFTDRNGYVELAEEYRAYVAQEGRLVPLEQRAKERPAVNLLKGAPIIWGAVDAGDWLAEARNWGILKGVLSNAHHCLDDPDDLREATRQGYITSEYENTADIQEGPVAFGFDDIEKTSYRTRPGAGPRGGWVTEEGLRHSSRSSAYGLAALKAYVPSMQDQYGFNGRFVDVSMALGLEEDFHPEHTFDRRQDMAYRRGFYEYLCDLGLVLGTEHGNDWGIDLVDYFEGALSGPYWWRGGSNWNAGMLLKPLSRDDYNDKYLKYGHGFDTRIPLWQLVYHDCTVSTWYWGDSPGFHYAVAPDIAMRKHLFAILYGSSTLVWRDWRGYDWDENPWPFTQAIHLTSHLQEQVAFARMMDHRFLSDDMAVQRTWFDSGHVVTVNFSDEPRTCSTDSGETVLLAPEGFYVEGPGIVQQKLQTPNGVELRIETDSFIWRSMPEVREIGAVANEGDFIAFPVEDRWHVLLPNGETCRVNVAALTGWPEDGDYVVYQRDDQGVRMRVIAAGNNGKTLALNGSECGPFLSIEQAPKKPGILIYPSGRFAEAGVPTLVSCTDPDADIHFTLDGTKPSPDTARYEDPLLIEESATLNARAFKKDRAVTGVWESRRTVVQELYASPLIKFGEPAKKIAMDVDGYAALRVFVDIGGDDCWADRLDLANPVLVKRDGTKVPLTEIEVIEARQTLGELRRVREGDDAFLSIAEQRFEQGYTASAEAEIIFELDDEYEQFETYVGIDDSATPPTGRTPRATVHVTIQGISALD